MWIVGFIVAVICIFYVAVGQDPPGPASCEGRCPEKYIPNLPCYCNEACMQYENCCDDYIALCNPRLATNDSWVNYNGHKYKYTEDGTSTVASANQSCRAMGALLVSMNTKAEFDFVSSEVLRWRTFSAFIGGSDIIEEGSWLWEDGSLMPLPDSNWHAWFDGEPDNDRDLEHCSIITNYYRYWTQTKIILKDYTWKDYICNYNAVNEIQGYVCEGTLKCDPNPCENGGSCFYTGQNPEFDCACPDKFVGDVCQYEIKENEIWTICGDTNLTATEGVITSPLYPKHYPPNTQCQWYISAEQQSTVSIRITQAHLETSKHCRFDSLMIYDDHNQNVTLFGPFCGGPAKDIIVTSSSNKAMIVLNTDKDVGQQGFKLTYSHHICGQGIGNSGCETRKTFTSQCGELAVNHKPEISSEQCDWVIQVNPGQKINITFIYFNLLDAGQDCKVDGVEVYEKDGVVSKLLGKYCGRRAPFTIYSSTPHVYLRLSNTRLLAENRGFSLQYQTYNSSEGQMMTNNNHYVYGTTGILYINDTFLFMEDDNLLTFKWHIQVPYGFYIDFNWLLSPRNMTEIKIFKGAGTSKIFEESYVISNTTILRNITIAYFQAVVMLTVNKTDIPDFNATFNVKEWKTEPSNCFTPFFYDNSSSVTTENNLISALNPVMLKISDNEGYPADMYCKWLIKSDDQAKLVIDIIDADIYPMTENCSFDGFVIYDGPNTSSPILGPFCGARSLEGKIINTESSEWLVVFYSDPDFGDRRNGHLRALIKQDSTDCPVWNMAAPSSNSFTASCGMIISPNFPGVVKQGLWFWTYEAPQDYYISLQVYYVKGPGTTDPECGQSLKVIEIPKDSSLLRQYEKDIIKLCGTTRLFIPPSLIKLPPNQKMGIELNTVINALPQKWQFKMSFTSHKMEEPKVFEEVNSTCPDSYMKWRNHCYRYYEWVQRHYNESYSWQQSWQRSLIQCQAENATLISIYDEDEAYFLKYTMATKWFWDHSTPFSLNHRLVYMGHKTADTDITWTDGVELSYADWYRPKPDWSQSIMYHDSKLGEIFNPNIPQPSAGVGSLCTGMLPLSPFESLNWIKIPCDYPMFRAGTICKKAVELSVNQTADQEEFTFPGEYKICPEGYFMIDGHCFTMITNYAPYINSTTMIEPFGVNDVDLCSDQGAELSAIVNVASLINYLHIWNHTESYGDILITRDKSNVCGVLKAVSTNNQRYYIEMKQNCNDMNDVQLGNVLCIIPTISVVEVCGSHEFKCANDVCISVDSVCDTINDCTDNSDEKDCECEESKFQCENGKCLSLSLRCDFVDNCGDMSDETDCVMENCEEDEFECKNKQCVPEEQICNFVYDCVDNSDEDPLLCGGKCSGFQCYSGMCIDTRLEKDGISDCPGLLFEDEAYRNNDLKTTVDVNTDREDVRNVSQICEEGGQYTKCSQSGDKCYDRSQACVYDTVMMDQTTGLHVQDSCRDGYHLRTNCEAIECPGMFHCPGSFCLPIRKVCDGKTDCPLGHDELNCDTNHCPGYFKCKSSNICIPHSEVCDGINNCGEQKDDEKYCGKNDPVCDVCTCEGHIAFCQRRDITTLPTATTNETRSLRAIFLDYNSLKLTQFTFYGLHWLSKLTIRSNDLKQIAKNSFSQLSNLVELDLSQNWLTELDPDCFNGLGKLKMLNLSHNTLMILYQESFNRLPSLQHLVIENNPSLVEINPSTFTQLLHLQTLNADAYKFCCIAPQVDVCTPAADEFSDCRDLMANKTLQICIWILGILATVGNLFVVIWRIITDHSKVSSMFIINLGCSDFLMGCYLVIIAVMDQYYRGRYIVHADRWKSSTLCQIAGVLAMFAAELSVFMLTAITMDRCLAIMFPFKFGRFRVKHARYIVILGWLLCFFLSVLPLTDTDYFGKAFFGSTGVCLPFHISHEKRPGWEYSVFIFFVLNSASFIVIFISYTSLFLTVRSSIKKVGEKATCTADDYSLAKKLVLIVATDFCCWVPIILIGFAALGGATISPQVSAWVAVFILPLNSAVNPILYTMSAIDCNKKKKQRQRSQYYSSAGTTGTTLNGQNSSKHNSRVSIITASNKSLISEEAVGTKKVTLNTNNESTQL